MPPANLNDLFAFAAVARLRSFRKAAGELGVSPSALSHVLRGLESRLGVRLLNRTTRSVAPTEEGEHLLARLSPALLDIEGALQQVGRFSDRQQPAGTLRITAPQAAAQWVLTPLIARFLAAHPGMQVELSCNDRLVDIVAEGFDAGVRFGERLQLDMVAIPLGPRQRFVVVGAPAYLAANGRPDHPRQLRDHRCIRIRFSSGSLYHWEFARGTESVQVEVGGPLTTGDMAVMTQAAIDGLGLAYLYQQYAAPALATGQLVQVLDDWCPQIAGFHLYYPSRRLVPAGLAAFVSTVRDDNLAASPAGPGPGPGTDNRLGGPR